MLQKEMDHWTQKVSRRAWKKRFAQRESYQAELKKNGLLNVKGSHYYNVLKRLYLLKTTLLSDITVLEHRRNNNVTSSQNNFGEPFGQTTSRVAVM